MFEQRPDIRERLDREVVIWMTTVDQAGQPQSSIVWFLAEADGFVVYSLARTPRARNIRANPRVCLALNSDPTGDGLVIIEGEATIVEDGVPASDDLEYIAKYRPLIDSYGWTPESFARDYPLRIHVRPTRLRAS
jgi:PPOX class probable F420-dependent enzyme